MTEIFLENYLGSVSALELENAAFASLCYGSFFDGGKRKFLFRGISLQKNLLIQSSFVSEAMLTKKQNNKIPWQQKK